MRAPKRMSKFTVAHVTRKNEILFPMPMKVSGLKKYGYDR
eukprot:UN00616